MISALKLLWGSTGGKISAILFTVLFAAGVAFAYSHGHTSGYASGFTAGQNSRDKEVTHLQENVAALTKIINDERKAQADKIKKVEAKAADAAVETAKRLGQEIRARDTIISSYRADVKPEIQQHCGLSVETVRAINALIQNVNEEHNEVPDLSAPPDNSSSADSTGGGADVQTTSTLTETK